MTDEKSIDVADAVEKTADVFFAHEKVTLTKVKISVSKTRVLIHGLPEELTREKKLQSIHIIEGNKITRFSGLYRKNKKAKRTQIFVVSKFNEETIKKPGAEK